MSSLDSPVLKRTTGTPVPVLERVELGDQPLVVAVEQRRRRNGATPLEQELDHPALVLQPGT